MPRIIDMNIFRRSLLLALAALVTLTGVLFVGVDPAAAIAPPSSNAAITNAASADAPHLTGATLTLSHGKIYPHRDGYRDSLGISVAKSVTGVSGASPLTGTVTIKRGSKTVAHYSITTSATETYAWSGRVSGAVKAGAYVVKAKIISKDATVTKHVSVVVSKHRLILHKKVIDIPAQQFFQHGYSSTSDKNGCVAADAGAISCSTVKGGAVTGSNYLPVPSAVLLFAGYEPYRAHISVTLSHAKVVAGTGTYWEWNGRHRFSFVADGTHKTSTSTFGAAQKEQFVEFRVSGGSAVHFDQVSISYTYAILG